jgi:hypothetical protein
MKGLEIVMVSPRFCKPEARWRTTHLTHRLVYLNQGYSLILLPALVVYSNGGEGDRDALAGVKTHMTWQKEINVLT